MNVLLWLSRPGRRCGESPSSVPVGPGVEVAWSAVETKACSGYKEPADRNEALQGSSTLSLKADSQNKSGADRIKAQAWPCMWTKTGRGRSARGAGKEVTGMVQGKRNTGPTCL